MMMKQQRLKKEIFCQKKAFQKFKKITLKSVLAASLLGSVALSPVLQAEDEVTLETVATFEHRPGNPSVSKDGRVFMSLQPLDQSVLKMVEVNAQGQATAYPSKEYSEGENAKFKAVIGVRTDEQGVAWVLDLGARKITAWDTKAEKFVKEIQLPESVLLPTSFLQDFALDQKRHRAIIADMSQGDLKSAPMPAFVVVDLETGESKRLAQGHKSLMPEMDGGFALNPITIDPADEWIYFGALHGKSLYRVPAAAFDGDTASLESQIELYGPKSYSDGITVDDAGNVYVTDIENGAVGVTNKDGYRILAHLPEGQSWPDGFAFGPDGFVYVTVNQLNRSAALNGGKETGSAPYLLMKFRALAQSRVGR